MGGDFDGLKNYYTPWYHARYDSSYTWFEGMNYPYGDHVVFADAQPLLSNTIKLLGLGEWTVGIMNYVLILSLFLTGWLLYRILLRWKANPWWAAVSAAAIAFLSPQLIRMNGHYALAYTFAVPLVWHLALRFFERPSLGRSLQVALPFFLMGWLHPYFIMISAVFMTALWGFHSLLAWKGTGMGHKALHYGVQVILPVALFTLCLKLTDPVTDRPANPYGIDEYVANWKTLFMPLALKVLERIPKAVLSDLPQIWEGVAFIGFAAVAMLLGFCAWASLHLFRGLLHKKLNLAYLVPGEELPETTRKLIAASMLAGIVVGLFSCGVPFSFKPELLTELFPPIKQFRSLGRFAWGFYYTWVTFSFFLFWQLIHWLRKRGYAAVGMGLAVVVAGWTLLEGAALNEGVRIRIWSVKLAKYRKGDPGMIPGMETSPWIASIQPEKYSAILALPFFMEGSENFRTGSSLACKGAFEASIRTGLPMVDVMMSRTSFSQSWGHIQLITEPAVPLEILAHIQDSRPLLGLRLGHAPDFDGPYVQRIGAAIYQQDTVELYEIDLKARQQALLAESQALPRSLWESPTGLRASRVDTGLIWMDFEQEGNAPGYHSEKGSTLALKDNHFFHKGPMRFAPQDTIVVSLWLRMRADRLPSTLVGFEELDGGETVTWDYLSSHHHIVRLDGEWALYERQFVIDDPQNTLGINVTRWKRKPPEIVVDDLLIRRKGTDVYRYQEGQPVWKNNRYMLLHAPPDTLGDPVLPPPGDAQ